MDIFVNGEHDVELPQAEPEETVEDYLQRLNEDFARTSRVVQIESINRQPLSEEMLDRQVQELERLDLTVDTIQSVAVDSILHLAGYLERALERIPDVIDDWSALDVNDRAEYREQLDEAFEAIDQVLGSLPSMVDLEQRAEPVHEIHQELTEIQTEFHETDQDEYGPALERTRDLFLNLRDELEHITGVLSQQLQELEQGRQKYDALIDQYSEEIPVLVEQLQSSATSETYDRVQEILEGLDGVLDYMNSLDKAGKIKLLLSPEQQDDLGQVHEELDTGLQELETAFEDKDVIMICDILEYEVQPYLGKIKDFLKKIEISPEHS